MTTEETAKYKTDQRKPAPDTPRRSPRKRKRPAKKDKRFRIKFIATKQFKASGYFHRGEMFDVGDEVPPSVVWCWNHKYTTARQRDDAIRTFKEKMRSRVGPLWKHEQQSYECVKIVAVDLDG